MSKVSIVSSVYNKAPYLVRCLDSLSNQTFRDIEIILVDNGSTDGSADIIEKYKAQDSRIQLIKLKKNIGSAGAFLPASIMSHRLQIYIAESRL